MDWEYYKKFLRPPVKGKKKGDLTPLFANEKVFRQLVNDISHPFNTLKFDKLAGIDCLGLILGAAMSMKMNKGMLTIRKANGLPIKKSDKKSVSIIDYSGKKKILEVDKRMIKKGERFVIVDDWVETGAQAKAAKNLIEQCKGKVVGLATIGFEKKASTLPLLDLHIAYVHFADKSKK